MASKGDSKGPGGVAHCCAFHYVFCGSMTPGVPPSRAYSKVVSELKDEKGDFFRQIVDFRAAKVRQHSNFDFQFTTDGVTTRILMFDATKNGKGKPKQLQSVGRS